MGAYLVSKNGREYSPQAVKGAVALYEGKVVNVNHIQPGERRSYQERIGVLRGVTFQEGSGLYGDLHYNPKHALAEQLVWDAQHAPENVGLSHDVVGRTSRRGDVVVVEEIESVRSVDLVADPATTRGLFEGAGDYPASARFGGVKCWLGDSPSADEMLSESRAERRTEAREAASPRVPVSWSAHTETSDEIRRAERDQQSAEYAAEHQQQQGAALKRWSNSDTGLMTHTG